MNTLAKIIRAEIEAHGPVPFARFMELALYHPEFGYYEQDENPIGKDGDFYTSVGVGSIFGEMLGLQFARWLQRIDAPQVQFVETGAHDGRLASDVLSYLAIYWPELFARLEFCIIEPSTIRHHRQKKSLRRFSDKVRWFKSWDEIQKNSITGVIYSNELLDAMPVHRLGWDAEKQAWFEWGVTVAENEFAWARLSTSPPMEAPHLDLPQELKAVLPDNFITEVSPQANQWWSQAAARLKHGMLVGIDYGLFSEQFFEPHRSHGTLRAYHHHRINDELLEKVGEQDLTAHVDFSAILRAGENSGLHSPADCLISQSAFLMQIYQAAVEQPDKFPEWTATRVRQFQTLTHPEHLGRPFSVLVQTRGMQATR